MLLLTHNRPLAVAMVYHPLMAKHEGGQGAGVEAGTRLLRRAILCAEQGSPVRADAAFELWLLTRRHKDTSEECEALLHLASSLGHNPARFGMHRPRSRDREPDDFRVSSDFAAVQHLLVGALEAVPLSPAAAAVCCNPRCGRWGVRAREVRRREQAGLCGLAGPPGLPRCQGMHGGHCKTRYCSRFCQALHWPQHRHECSMP